MHVIGIRLKNFARFKGEHEVAPLGPIAYAIVARHEDDEQRSNYLGKTTLPVALRYCLHGVLPDSYDTLDAVISKGEEEMAVEVELSDGTFIARERKRGKWARLMCVAADGTEYNQDTAQQAIERAIGLDLANYDVCADIAQKKADRFSQMKSTQITEVVNGWVGLDRLINAEDAAAKGLAQLTRELALVEQQCTALEWATPEEGVRLKSEARAAAQTLKEAIATATEANQKVAVHGQWVAHQKRAEYAAGVAEQRATLRSSLEQLPAVPPSELELTQQKNELADARERMNALAMKCRSLSTVAGGKFDGACPVLPGFVCPARGAINESREQSSKALGKASDKYETASRAHDSYASKLRQSVEVTDRLAELTRRISELDATYRGFEDSVGFIAANGEPPDRAPESVEVNNYDSEAAKRAVSRWQGACEEYAQLILERDRRQTRIAAFRIAVLALEQAQRRLSEGVVQRVERGANQRLVRAGVDLRVEFHWGRETNKLATRCGSCGAEFPASQKVKQCQVCNAVRGPKIEPKLHLRFSSRSGAVEDITGVAISLAASRWIRERRGAAWGTIVLDEVFTSLDASLRRGLTGHLNQLVTDGFEQAFVVAHSRDVLESLPGRIEVVGSSDWSSVRVVA